jgi:hypothetical protein
MTLKGFTNGFGFLGNYLSLVVPVVIAIVAFLVFVPTQLMSGSLKKRMADDSIRKAQAIKSLTKTAVSSDQWKLERRYQQTFKDGAEQAGQLALQTSMREPLVYNVFPEPEDKSMLVFREFGRRFREALDGLVAGVNGRDCPTDVELESVLQRSAGRARRGRGRLHVGGRTIDDAILDVLCTERARSTGVYVNPADINGYEFWADYLGGDMDRAVKDAWYYQLGYWIIEDVFKTVAALNAGSENLLAAPVKRIMLVAFELQSRGLGRKKASGEKPRYVVSDKDKMIDPLTVRTSNDDIDVVHFNLAVVVSDGAVMPFMQELCSVKRHVFKGFSGSEGEKALRHNQITILQSGVWPVDREGAVHALYRYGQEAAVELNLICEYVFIKAGYDRIKPASVTEDLNKARAAAVTGGRGGRRSRARPGPAGRNPAAGAGGRE